MLVNSVCCSTCRKRVSPLQAPYRRMRMGSLTYEDACRVILHNNPEIFDVASEMPWIDRISYLDDILNAELSDEQELYISRIRTIPLEAAMAHSVMGVIRWCCKSSLNDPPIAPTFAAKQPEKSKLIVDSGEIMRIVLRKGSGYELQNYYGDISN